jgi:hypothetical protein
MPDYMTIEQTYRIVGGYTAVNVLHFIDIGGDFDQATVDSIVTSWGTDVVFASLDQDVIADGDVRCSLGFPEATSELFAGVDDHIGGSTGALNSVSTTYNVALSAGSGRRSKGRIFLPGVDEAKVDDGGVLVGTTAADILENVGDWIAAVASGEGWLLGVGSRVDEVVRGVSSVEVKNYVGSQRRRLTRVSYGA